MLNNNYISDAALDSYYASIFEKAYGYDPFVGPYTYTGEYEEDEEDEESEVD